MEFAAKDKTNGATIGFEEKLWAAADRMRGHMDEEIRKQLVRVGMKL